MKRLFPLIIIIVILVSCEKKGPAPEILEPGMKHQAFYALGESGKDTILTTDFYYPDFEAIALPAFIQDTIMAFILHADWAGSNTRAQKAEDVFTGIKKDYEDLRQEFENYHVSWSLVRKVHIIYQTAQFVSLSLEEMNFLGGAHPNTTEILVTYNIQEETPVLLNSLVREGQEPRLTAAAESVFRRQKDLEPNESLIEAGYFFSNDRFFLTSNFAVTDQGIRFLYNRYEIAPYYLGPTEILLKWDEIRDCLKDPEAYYTESIQPETGVAKSPV